MKTTIAVLLLAVVSLPASAQYDRPHLTPTQIYMLDKFTPYVLGIPFPESRELRELERDGLVQWLPLQSRTVLYRITSKGRTALADRD